MRQLWTATTGLIAAVFLIASPTPAQEPVLAPDAPAEEATGFSTASWCRDTGTICWDRSMPAFAGLRVIGEPKFGTIFNGGGDRLELSGFEGLSVFGVEVNLFGAWAAFQASLISPGRVSFDEQSDVVVNGRLLDENREVDVDVGFAGGVAFFDGVIVVGGGYLNFDERDFTNPIKEDTREVYWYFNVQPVSLVRAVFKRAQ